MTEVSRRKLFVRGEPEHPLTPQSLDRLHFVAQLQPLTVAHLAALVGCTPRAARDTLRVLFHHGLVERTGIPPAVLADPDTPNSPALLYGRAPTLYTLSRAGLQMLLETGRAEKDAFVVPARYGPKNWLFLAHELQVRDVRGWLARVERAYPTHPGLSTWRMGKAAWIDIAGGQVRPDALFTYGLPHNTLFRFVEVDRGTERAPVRWQEKFDAYMALLPDLEQMRASTGQETGRVLIVTPNAARCEQLWGWLTSWMAGQSDTTDRFWLSDRSFLGNTNLAVPLWRVAGREDRLPLVPLTRL